MKKQIELTLDQAKEMFGQNETIDKMLLANFPGLNRVTKWEDLGEIQGYYSGACSNISFDTGLTHCENRNMFATKEQAEASIALAQLSQLMKHANGDWKPDWGDGNSKYIIDIYQYSLEAATSSETHFFLCFPTSEIRDQFLEDHRQLIEKAKPLL